ncbi:MAG: B12-binding domain-containing radical SAM protein, partial [Firmicutes bacterium]|nr:B12-binding domain-containing radical SAM protein [Bacillota bacterium]
MIDRKKLDAMLKRVMKPARYIGNETNLIVKENAKVRFAFAFPDKYEIGMSYVGLQILYDVINSVDDVACERVFAPDKDMEELMRSEGMPLFSLETKREVSSFDLLGFTLQYEMSFTNILNMLDLAGIPPFAEDRGCDMPVVMAGGPCAYNPEPLARFFDLFIIGDGELVQPELCRIYKEMKEASADGQVDKEAYLTEVQKIQGTYVPSFYDVEYNEDGTVKSYTPNREGVPERVTRALIDDIED